MKVVNISTTPHTHFIGRASSYRSWYGINANLGNPFWMSDESRREAVCALYEKYARENPVIMARIKALPEQAVLGCFCAPKQCHGDVIVKLWKEMHDAQS